MRILISAGEASGDWYAAELARALQLHYPGVDLFGCAGPRMRAAGVRAVVEAESLSVVGLVEVLQHLPRIHGEYRRLLAAAEHHRPELAILTDSPDFHLRVATRLKRMGIPVVYLVAPQVWAWRKARIHRMRRDLSRLLCIFPFEPEFFHRHGLPADYIGHPLTVLARPSIEKAEFLRKHGLTGNRPLVTLLPGSRVGEAGRHLPVLDAAIRLIRKEIPVDVVLAIPNGFRLRAGERFFRERIDTASIQVIEGETQDAIAHADLALPASGTVTVEAALLGTPMVTYYKVTGLSWWMGRFLVDVPFYSMVNLVAGRKVVPELIQTGFTPEAISQEACKLLRDPGEREKMRAGLREVAARLAGAGHPIERAVRVVAEMMDGKKDEAVP